MAVYFSAAYRYLLILLPFSGSSWALLYYGTGPPAESATPPTIDPPDGGDDRGEDLGLRPGGSKDNAPVTAQKVNSAKPS